MNLAPISNQRKRIQSSYYDLLGTGFPHTTGSFEFFGLINCTFESDTQKQKATSRSPFLLHIHPAYPTHFLAFWNMRSHAPFSCQSLGCHEFCTARNTRSGCGIMMLKRPSGVVSPVMPCGEPLGLSG